MSPTRCEFKFRAAPLDLPLSCFDGGVRDAFFATGIINPFGPTVNVVVSLNVTREGKHPLVHAVLNPFSQQVRLIGTFKPGNGWVPQVDFEPLYHRDLGSCPTLLLLHSGLDERTRHDVALAMLRRFPDAPATMARVRRFLGDLSSRLEYEMETAGNPRPPIDTDERTWLELLEASVHLWPELFALNIYWKACVDRVGSIVPRGTHVMSEAHFLEIFGDVSQKVWKPVWPSGMGFRAPSSLTGSIRI